MLASNKAPTLIIHNLFYDFQFKTRYSVDQTKNVIALRCIYSYSFSFQSIKVKTYYCPDNKPYFFINNVKNTPKEPTILKSII